MKWLKYCGFFGFLGCLYFIYRRTSLLSGFLFFSFFRFYYLEKILKLNINDTIKIKINEISQKVFFIPIVALFIIAGSYTTKMEVIVCIAVFSIVITFIGSTMVPYFYARKHMKNYVYKDN